MKMNGKLMNALEVAGAGIQNARSRALRQFNSNQNVVTLTTLLGRLLASCLLIGLSYCGLYLSVGEPFKYGGPAWSAMLIWASAQGLGWLFGVCHLPALLGQLLMGLILKNLAPHSISGLPRSWSTFLRSLALGTIFLRSGLELDITVFKRVGFAAVRLLLIPGLTEAFVAGALAHPILGLPVLWGFTLGFILKAVGPAIVITTMYEIQKKRLGIAKGIPSIIVAAASFDDMVAITGYGLFSNFAFAHHGGNLGWQIAHGPVEIVLGTVGGIIGGLFCSMTCLWRTRFQRSMVAFATAISLLFTFYHYDMKSAGPLAALVTGMVLRVCLDSGRPGPMSLGPDPEYARQIEHHLGIFWRWVAQPLLFGLIGTLVSLRSLHSPTMILKALGLIVIGLIVRAPMSFMAVAGAGLTVRERLFIAIAWTPKATVQAALGPLPLDTILAREGPDSPNIEHAEAILTTSVLAILVCGTIGVMGIHICAPKCLAVGNDPSPGTEEHKRWLETRAQLATQAGAEAGGSQSEDAPEEPTSFSPDNHDDFVNHDLSRLDNGTYEPWRVALHGALSQTRTSLANLLGSTANLLNRRRLGIDANPAGRDTTFDLQGMQRDRMGRRVPASALVMLTSPSAPPVLQSGPGHATWLGPDWLGLDPAVPEAEGADGFSDEGVRREQEGSQEGR